MTQNKGKNPLLRVQLSTLPSWLPRTLARALTQSMGDSSSLRFRFSTAERTVLRRQKWISPSQWAERRRVVRLSSLPGRWQNLFTPYLVGIMDAARFPGVEVVILCKTPQTGGSEAGMNILGQMIEMSPGPAMLVFPDELTAKENAKDRILPMLQDSPRLRTYMSGSVDEASSIRINLRHMPIYLGWSGSVSRLGNKPIRILILDELDKYQNIRKEASSEALAEKRTITWKSRRFIFKISTPTTEEGPIWKAFTEEAHARFDYHVICPHCGTAQKMVLEQIRWPEEEKDPEKVLAGRLAWYECPHCVSQEGGVPRSASAAGTTLPASESECPAGRGVERRGWSDADRDRAVRKGYWVERASGLELFAHLHHHSPTKIGFHLPSWYSYFISLSQVAHAALKWQKSGRLEDLKDFRNQFCAEPWVEERSERSEDAILSLCDTRPQGTVPGGIPFVSLKPTAVASGSEQKAETAGAVELASPRMCTAAGAGKNISVLLAGVDTQGTDEHKGYFRYTIRAFGYGETEESWLVSAGVAVNFGALNEILWKSTYCDAAGNEHKVRSCMIDAMGRRTREVYSWAIRHRGRALPWQGVQHMTQPFSPASIEYFPDARGNKIRIPGGLTLMRCDTTFFKSDLAHRLSILPDDPGAFHLHANTNGMLEQYAREMCVECYDAEKMAWINPQRKANHYWDCEVMTLALAYILNVRHMRPPQSETNTTRRAARQTLPRGGLSIADKLARVRR